MNSQPLSGTHRLVLEHLAATGPQELQTIAGRFEDRPLAEIRAVLDRLVADGWVRGCHVFPGSLLDPGAAGPSVPDARRGVRSFYRATRQGKRVLHVRKRPSVPYAQAVPAAGTAGWGL